ncbi:MAG TPA: carbohydrate-binding domain-containing protein [Polyangiaceae bacterium]|nr:carbohydrate-binding domain-containing protein [Polyangiaceae bacterium]
MSGLAAIGCSGVDIGSAPGSEAVGEQHAALTPATDDLDVGFIQRLPALDYVQNSTNPRVEGWPAVGQSVTWRGNVHNFSSAARTVNYVWTVDGATVKSGSITLPAQSVSFVDYAAPWAFQRHQLKLSVDTSNSFAEVEENNNSLTVFTDALSVGFYVEQGLYDYFNTHQHELVGVGSNSWDDWAQRQIKRWNDMYAAAVYAGDAPAGVLDRVRLDKITVVPDAALPLAGGLPTNNPNMNDFSVDLQWGFPSSALNNSFYTGRDVSDSNAFYYEGSLIHESQHARYLLDNYGFNVHDSPTGGRDVIDVLENGASIVGTPFLPQVASDAVYFNHQPGMMNGDYSFIDQYGTMALNLIAGRRAVNGNMNAPGNFAAFINDLPAENEITLVDANGAALPGASVSIYRSVGGSNGIYSKHFDAIVDQTATADSAGKIRVGRNPFTTGTLDGWHESTVMLLRVAQAGRVRYVFMEVADFNKEFWRGHTSLGTYTLTVPFATAPARSIPSRVQAEDYDRFMDATAGNTGGGCPRAGDVDMENTADTGGGCDVGWTDPGEWLEWDVQTATAQTFDIVSRVASAYTGKTFHVEVDGVAVGGTQASPSGGWQAFQDRTVSGVSLTAGAHRIRVVFDSGLVNLNYLDVLASSGVPIPARIEAESYVRFQDSTVGNSGGSCRSDDVDVQTTTDPNGGVCNIGWTTAGEWLEYDVRSATTRSFSITARLAAITTGRTIHLELDGVNIGSLTAPSSGWQAFQDRTLSGVNVSAGSHRLRVVFDTGSANLNYITFN